ncbi:isopeptide-forming domain-containing fimbrial protein [Collinsella sp. AM33-4BH]|nr:isopeptide-forming domain-containing fimbrial protein [Collinsella sp. OM04-5]RHC32012.1 isopeptide-forming domain-containing fimbrial protein [Collinsella sp. AM36-4AA]RHC93446.1 isopeptide-forming domain-containing fimbrial protein [Collinsella sp. AM33-4BH]RHJ29324.1 isopeptide-forming domain-containing fimbrial protein [Collinsella sp. AM12-1]
MRREVSVVNKKVCSFPILFALLALLIGICAVVFPASAQAAPTSTGSITVSGAVASNYDAYQIFSANVVDGDGDAKTFTDLAWASDAARDAVLPVLHSAGMPDSQTTAQEAAEWLNTDSHLTSALSAQLARSLQSSGAVPVALNAGTAAELPCGYWLIVARDDAIAQGEAGTAPIMALVGGNAVTVKPKAATPKVAKHVLEDNTAAWQKAADATVADDLYWRLSATVPAGLSAYDTYAVQFVDTMSAGLDPSKVAASMRVYVAAGADGTFDAVSNGKDGRAGTEPAQGWTDITAQCATKVAADGTFTVRTGDLIAALGGADAFAAGARVVAVYNAPLNSACNRGIAKGNPNEVYLRYPRSPFADQSGDAGFTRTPSDDACAYTWDLALTKRGSDGDKPLAGAVLSIADDRGRTLAADGTWDAEGKATVTTGEDGRVTVSGVDSGKLEVRELKAPKGYTAFEGTRSVTVKAEGLDVDQVAAAKPKVTVSAESPLRVDAADAGKGLVELSVLNTPSNEVSRGFMPSTGDRTLVLVTALAVIGVVAIVVALVIKRGGGRHDK